MSEKGWRYTPRSGTALADAVPVTPSAKKTIPLRALSAVALVAGGLALAASPFAVDSILHALPVTGLSLIALGILAFLLDLYLQPVPVRLPSGHAVMRPRSRTPIVLAILVPAVLASLHVTAFDLSILWKRGYQFTVILRRIFSPHWGFLEKVWPPLLDTIRMSVMGSVIGSTLALPVAVFASTNINRSTAAVAALRVVLNVIRTLPTLVIASVCALIFRLGTFAGTVAITVFTFGIVSRMLYESIETIDMGPFEALESLGAGRIRAFTAACLPQILPTYLSYCLYSFEINVRAASILGYVGAGGLGILINETVGWRDYESLGTILAALFVTVLVIENLSAWLRRRLS